MYNQMVPKSPLLMPRDHSPKLNETILKSKETTLDVQEEESTTNTIALLQLHKLEEMHLSAKDIATQTRQNPALQ